MRYILLFIVLASFCIPSVASNQSVLNSTQPTSTKAWVGAAIAAGASLLGGLMANNSQRKGTKEQLRAQELENQRNREYNLMLAQQQNAWNVEQWERENEYNDPAAQLKRFKNAGLNPDLMVGSGAQNLSAPSPTMTAGAPSTPQDMSALGRRPSFGEAVQIALRDSMIGAQIDNIKAQTRKTNAEAGISESDAKYRDMLNALDVDIKTFEKNASAQQAEMMYEQYEIIKKDLALKGEQLKQAKLDTVIKGIESSFKSREVESLVKKLENEAKISEEEAKFAVEATALRIMGLKAETEIVQDEAGLSRLFNDASEDSFGNIGVTILRIVRYIMSSIGKFL